jgi:(5-formylfuran-3-yl)methyl phosphate synthase
MNPREGRTAAELARGRCDDLLNHSFFSGRSRKSGEAMTQLLVSVRNTAEAEAALHGGAGLIDVKEPGNGALGKADDAVIEEVVRAVAGRAPVSAALGDFGCEAFQWNGRTPSAPDPYLSNLTYVKLGFAGLDGEDWRELLPQLRERVAGSYPGALLVVAAYADWEVAAAPPPEDICALARETPRSVFLIDTWSKGCGRTLLDWMSFEELARLCERCRSSGVRTALAGSLGHREIGLLMPVQPDWIAVRGAACAGGRGGTVSEYKVRELAALIRCQSCGS